MDSSANLRSIRVLAIGPDISRLSSGANVLTLAGYNTDFVLNSDEAARRASVPRYSLAIVSSSFTHDEQLALLARLRQVRPSLPVLLLGPEHDSPASFLAAVADCLSAAQKPPISTLDSSPSRPGNPRRPS